MFDYSSNYPDGINMDDLDGASSLADQVDPDAIVLPEGLLGELVIIGTGEDYQGSSDYLSYMFSKYPALRQKLAKRLGLNIRDKTFKQACQNDDAELFIQFVQNQAGDLDDLLLDSFDGEYGEDATDIDAQ